MDSGKTFDLLVIGGGINGTGIALDATGRGLSVILCEQNDLASGTSSASSKLIHGGLRYLEHYDFKLVSKALTEREILLNKARHLIYPQRFVIPHIAGLRPKWLIQLGLWLYNWLAHGSSLARPCSFKFTSDNPYTPPLLHHNGTGFSYSDCYVDDSRLVVANALGAAQLGAGIYTRAKVTSLHVQDKLWEAAVYDEDNHITSTVHARAVVNATGPWIQSFLDSQHLFENKHHIRLVRGSHLIVSKRYEGAQAYVTQNKDGRIVFVIPFEQDFTLIGTTEVATEDPPESVHISEEEKQYLIDSYNANFRNQITSKDIVQTYSGVRPLVDQEGVKSTELSRDYLLETILVEGAPILCVYGGKITTYRTLAEAALHQLKPYFPEMRDPWTAYSPLPGGENLPEDFDDFLDSLKERYPWLPAPMLHRLARQQGNRIHLMLKNIESLHQMGQHFGADCYEEELRFLVEHEWARSVDDLLFRRTKLGLHLKPEEISAVEDWLNRTLGV